MDQKTQSKLEKLKRETSIDVLTPRILDVMFKSRNAGSSYASTGGSRMTVADEMLEIEWQGVRYVIPAYKKK